MHVYTVRENLSNPYYAQTGMASIYFRVAENIVYSDSVIGKRFISLIESRYSSDTISYDYGGEDDKSYLLTGRAAARVLQYWSYQSPSYLQKKFSLGLEIIKDKTINQLKSQIVSDVSQYIDKQLDNEKLTEDEIKKNYLLLREFITDYKIGVPVFVKHWKSFRRFQREHELLAVLSHSSDETLQLQGIQLQSLLALDENKFDQAIDILFKGWQKHPDVVFRGWDSFIVRSLVPSAITIDSLLFRTHDYQVVLSFVNQLQKHLTPDDSTLNNFLEGKKLQLCAESDCPAADYHFRDEYNLGSELGTYSEFPYLVREIERYYNSKDIIHNEVVVNKNASLKNGVHGKEVKRFKDQIKGRILYEYCQYPGPGHDHPVKITTTEGIFWVDNNDLQRVFNRPLFYPSEKKELITDPVVTEVLPLPQSNRYLIAQVNNDDVPDLICTGNSDQAIDGKSMKTLWHKQNGHPTIIGKNMYISESSSSLSKRSIQDKFVWTMNRKLPYNYNGFVHPVIRYNDKIYTFTGNGYLLEISDKDGTWINTYKFPHRGILYPIFDGETLYFINSPDEPQKIKTLFAVNLASREVAPLFTFTSQHGKVVVANNKIYLLAGNKIFAINRNGSASSYDGAVDIGNFIVKQNYLIACGNNSVQVYDLKQAYPIWKISVPYPLNYNVIAKDDIVYICAGDQLMLLSLINGTTLKKLPLPFPSAASDGAITYHENKILISGNHTMMIIEGK